MKETIVTTILQGFDQKKQFLVECFWFKFNNLELTQSMALKFYISVEKELKLKVRKFWALIPTFVEVTGNKLEGWVLIMSFIGHISLLTWNIWNKIKKLWQGVSVFHLIKKGIMKQMVTERHDPAMILITMLCRYLLLTSYHWRKGFSRYFLSCLLLLT